MPAPNDIRFYLNEVAEQLRVAESALGKARHALGGAFHAEAFSQQGHNLQTDKETEKSTSC